MTGSCEIDQRKPRSSFNFEIQFDRYACDNWKNLRLISPTENRSKRAKVDKDLIYFFSIIADVF